jgi:hypothetical protein
MPHKRSTLPPCRARLYSAMMAPMLRDRIHAQAAQLTCLVLNVDIHFPTPSQLLEELAHA